MKNILTPEEIDALMNSISFSSSEKNTVSNEPAIFNRASGRVPEPDETAIQEQKKQETPPGWQAIFARNTKTVAPKPEIAAVEPSLEPLPVPEIKSEREPVNPPEPAIEPIIPPVSEPKVEPTEPTPPLTEPATEEKVVHPLDQKTAEGFAKYNITPEQLISLEGFADLSEAQQRLFLENYKQFALDDVKAKGRQGYLAELAKATGLNDKKEYTGWQAAPDRFWKKAFKKYYLAKETTEAAKQLDSPENTKVELAEDRRKILEQLVAFSANSRVNINDRGELIGSYIYDLPDLEPEQQKLVDDFNRAADDFSHLPYEWSLDSATSEQQKSFKDSQNHYHTAKESLSRLLKDTLGEKEAILRLSQADNQLRLNQFLNTHPEAEKELLKIKSQSAWKQAWNNVVAERTLYAGMGFAARTATASVLQVAAAPLVASVMGGWLGRKRAKEGLTEKDVEARRGTDKALDLLLKIKELDKQAGQAKTWQEEDEFIKQKEKLEKERAKLLATDKNFITVEVLNDKLGRAITELDRAFDPFVELDEATLKIFESLRARLKYTKDKLDKGLVNFGSAENRLINQQELIDRLNLGETKLVGYGDRFQRARALKNIERKQKIRNFKELNFFQQSKLQSKYELKEDLVGRLERFLSYREGKIDQSRKVYLIKQMLKGAFFGAAFASAGAAIRDFIYGEDITPEVEKITRQAKEADSLIADLPDLPVSDQQILESARDLPSTDTVNLELPPDLPAGSRITEVVDTSLAQDEPLVIEPTQEAVSGAVLTHNWPVLAELEKIPVFKNHLPADADFLQSGTIDSKGSISEALHKAMTGQEKNVTVINPDGTEIKEFDPNLVHEGDTVIATKSGQILVYKTSAVKVEAGQSLQGRYDEIVAKFKLDEIPDEVKDQFNEDKGQGGFHRQLNYQEAKAAHEDWVAHHDVATGTAPGGVTIVPDQEVVPAAPVAGHIIEADKSDILAGLDIKMANGDELHFYDSDDADDAPNSLAAKTQDGTVFYQVSLTENLTHAKAEELIAQAKLASTNLTDFSNHLGSDRQEAARFYEVYDQADNIANLAEYKEGDFGQLDSFVAGLKDKRLDLLTIDGQYSPGLFALTSKWLHADWNQDDISNQLREIDDESKLNIALGLVKANDKIQPLQLSYGLQMAERLDLNEARELAFAQLAADADTDFGVEPATAYAHRMLGDNFEATRLNYNRTANQIHIDGLTDGTSPRHDVVFLIKESEMVIVDLNQKFNLTDDELNRLSDHLKVEAPVAPITPKAGQPPIESSQPAEPVLVEKVEAAAALATSVESQNLAIRTAVEAAAGQVMRPDEQLVYFDDNGDGVVDVVGLAVKAGRPYFTMALPKEIGGQEQLDLTEGIQRAQENLNRMLESLNKAPGISADRAQAAEFMPIANRLHYQFGTDIDQGIARAFEATSYTKDLSMEKDIVIATLAQYREGLSGMSQKKLDETTDLLFGQSIKAAKVHSGLSGSEKLIFEGKILLGQDKPTFSVILDFKENHFSILNQKGVETNSGDLTNQELDNIPYYLRGETPPELEPETPSVEPAQETKIETPLEPTGPDAIVQPELNPESALLKGYDDDLYVIGKVDESYEFLVKGGKIVRIDRQAVELGQKSDGSSAIDANSAVYTRQAGNTIYNYTVIRDSAGKLTIIENKHELPGANPPPVQENNQQPPNKPAEPEIKSNPQEQSQLNLKNLSHDFESLTSFRKLNADQQSVIISALQAEQAKGLKIPDNGYVIYVNKNPQAQWAALLHFDQAKNQFAVLGADVVSTANAAKYAGAETPAGVHYVTRVGDAGTWGKPYGQPGHEVYDLSEGTGIAFHPTNEQELLGNPASHGCVRMTNKFNDLLDKYDVLAKGSPVMIGDFLEKSELSPNLADLPSAGYEISRGLEDEVGKPYNIGKAGYDCMTLVRQAARENKGEYPVLDDYNKFLRTHAGKPEELKFSVFLREQPMKFENASWSEVKQKIEPGEYLINMESGGGKTYGPEGHGAILSVIDGQNGNKQFTMYHASTAALMPQGEKQPVPLHELRLEIGDQSYQGREIVEKFKAEYQSHINDHQADGSKLYDKWLTDRIKFFDGQGNQVKPKLEADGSLRLGYVTKETDMDSYFKYNQDFAKNIDVLPLTKETPVLAKAA